MMILMLPSMTAVSGHPEAETVSGNLSVGLSSKIPVRSSEEIDLLAVNVNERWLRHRCRVACQIRKAFGNRKPTGLAAVWHDRQSRPAQLARACPNLDASMQESALGWGRVERVGSVSIGVGSGADRAWTHLGNSGPDRPSQSFNWWQRPAVLRRSLEACVVVSQTQTKSARRVRCTQRTCLFVAIRGNCENVFNFDIRRRRRTRPGHYLLVLGRPCATREAKQRGRTKKSVWLTHENLWCNS